MALLALCAMLLGAVTPAHAVCGLMPSGAGPASGPPTGDTAHVNHAGMGAQAATDEPAMATALAAGADAGLNSCGMCVGNGVCDHGTCTTALLSDPDRMSGHASGGHHNGIVLPLHSHTFTHQPPPPRLFS